MFNTAPSVGRFFNSELIEGNQGITRLTNNNITSLSKKAVVGLATALSTTPATGLVPGVNISQFDNLNASATLINTAGVAKIGDANAATIINPGVGYTPQGASLTYTNVPMVTQTGEGSGAVGNVTVQNGVISSVTFTDGGNNYALGDTLGIGTLGLGNGSGAVLSVGIVSMTKV